MHIELSYLYSSIMPVSLNSISLRRVDFKFHGNLEILVVSPLWQMFIGHEGGEKFLEKCGKSSKIDGSMDERSFGIKEF